MNRESEPSHPLDEEASAVRRTPLEQEDDDAHELQEHEFTLEPEDIEAAGPFDEHTVPWGTLPLPPLPPWATTSRALLEPPTLPGRVAGVYYDDHPTPAAEPIATTGLQLRALREELALAQRESAERAIRIELLERAIADSNAAIAARQARVEYDRAEQRGRLAGQAYRLADLEQSLRETGAHAAKRIEELEASSRRASEAAARDREELEASLRRANEAAARDREELEASLKRANEAAARDREELEASLKRANDESEREIAQLKASLRHANEDAARDVEQLETSLKRASDEFARELEQLEASLTRANDASAREIEQLEASLRRVNDDAAREIERVEAERATAEEAAREARAACARAELRLEQLEAELRSEQKRAAQQAADDAAELTPSAVIELDTSDPIETTLELTARDLEEATELSEPSIEVQRIDAGSPEAEAIYAEALGAELEASTVAASEPSAELDSTPALESSVRELKPKRRAARSVRRDDLTQIRGIGKRYAERLAELGVSTFARIAAWEAADLERAGEKLGIGAKRIQREGWVKQARKLKARAETKTGAAAPAKRARR